jgi:hypothetical protein
MTEAEVARDLHEVLEKVRQGIQVGMRSINWFRLFASG